MNLSALSHSLRKLSISYITKDLKSTPRVSNLFAHFFWSGPLSRLWVSDSTPYLQAHFEKHSHPRPGLLIEGLIAGPTRATGDYEESTDIKILTTK